MLSRELLLYRVRQGRIHPAFLEPDAAPWPALAEDLVAIVEDAVGQGSSRETLQTALEACCAPHKSPKVARGLAKLLLDRVDFGEPAPEVAALRAGVFRQAAGVLATLEAHATLEDYEARLTACLGRDLGRLRAALHTDLPMNRTARSWRALGAKALVDRYNLALAQGHLLSARRLTLHAAAPDLLRVRRLLRWLKLCRLVAEVRRRGEDWELEVEGPGAVLELQRKYGLQLANFVAAVPVLRRFELTAHVVGPGRRAELTLRLTHEDPLVSPLGNALGHLPDEVRRLAGQLTDAAWQLDDTPLPRHVGAKGMCVPDFTLRHQGGRKLALELFHPWHAGPLLRRLADLQARPDRDLLLGVERALARRMGRLEELASHPQVVLFHGFPSARAVLERICDT